VKGYGKGEGLHVFVGERAGFVGAEPDDYAYSPVAVDVACEVLAGGGLDHLHAVELHVFPDFGRQIQDHVAEFVVYRRVALFQNLVRDGLAHLDEFGVAGHKVGLGHCLDQHRRGAPGGPIVLYLDDDLSRVGGPAGSFFDGGKALFFQDFFSLREITVCFNKGVSAFQRRRPGLFPKRLDIRSAYVCHLFVLLLY